MKSAVSVANNPWHLHNARTKTDVDIIVANRLVPTTRNLHIHNM